LRVVCDTGPLLAAANRRDRAHAFAAAVLIELGRETVIPEPVLVEVDQLLRSRVGMETARLFLAAVAAGERSVAYVTPGLLRRAVDIDVRFPALDLGLVDAMVMAVAEREGLPILTFDFRDFRAAPPEHQRAWSLVIDEERYAKAIRLG
jgi:predicted nucleic acid-binding protein